MSEKNGLAVVQPSAPVAIRGPRLGLPTQQELDALLAYGAVIVKSGLAPQHVKTPEAALVIMRQGHQLGIDEFTALNHMFVVGGKPTSLASLLHTLILRDHGGDGIQVVESTAQRCELRCKRRDSSHVATIVYTMDEAKQAGLTGGNWAKYPADMLFARAVSRAGRQVFRDSTMGMYTPEELGGDVIEVAGEVVVGRASVVDDGEPLRTRANGKLDRLHAVGAERGLDHDALHRVTRFKFPHLGSMAELTEAMADDLANAVETAGEDELALWETDWTELIAAAERTGMEALRELNRQMRAAGVTSSSHPWLATAWADAKRRVESRPPAEIVDAEVTQLLPGVDGEAGRDRYTA